MKTKKENRLSKLLMACVLLIVCSGMESNCNAASDLIFHSGFEPNTIGVLKSGDNGNTADIVGKDNSFLSNNDWDENFQNYTKYGNFVMEYESNDNSHHRYANIVDDSTNTLFEDSFDDAYNIDEVPHKVSGDMGKRNWSAYTTTNAVITVQGDPADSANQVMRVLSTNPTNFYPKLDKQINASVSQKIIIDYSVKNMSSNTYIEIQLPSVSGVPTKTVIRVNGSLATAGAITTSINPNDWTHVVLECDLHNNFYNAIVNEVQLVANEPLFSSSQTDFSNVKVRFSSFLANTNYFYLDNVKIKETSTMFEDDFEYNYNIGDTPKQADNDKGRWNWSSYTTSNAQLSVINDPDDPSNNVMKVLSNNPVSCNPKLEKNLDISVTKKMTIEYKVKNLSQNTFVELQLPTVNGAPLKKLIHFNGSTVTVGTSSRSIVQNEWITVSLMCDLHNNTYKAIVNGIDLGTQNQLFDSVQADFRNVKIRFNASISNGSYYYLDNVKISNTHNKVLKYYAGKVVNDTKLRIQASMLSNNNLNEIYYKYRIYY